MSLSELEEHVLAYYLENGAADLNMVGRFWPRGELVLVIEDKVQLATRKFGVRANLAGPKVARALLEILIERGAFSTVKGDHGSTMHQYQKDAYRTCIGELQASNPIIAKARAAGPGWWDEAFAALQKG
jgi:hypothetical protein